MTRNVPKLTDRQANSIGTRRLITRVQGKIGSILFLEFSVRTTTVVSVCVQPIKRVSVDSRYSMSNFIVYFIFSYILKYRIEYEIHIKILKK